jgi:F0F1-type ATP synthase assembly protein I
MAEPARSRRIVDQGGSLLGIGIQLVVTILGFAALGWWLDQRFDTRPWLLLAGLIFGATGGMISFIRTAIRAGKQSSRKPGEERPASSEPISRDE